MALGTPTDGGAAYSASGGTTVSTAYPASIASGDCLVLIVGQKPSSANGGTIGSSGAITGWTQREALTGAGGYGTTLGADTGNTNLWIYTKDTVSGTETGNLSVTIGTNNVSWGIIVRIPSGAGSFEYGSADGSRTTAPTSGVAFTTALTTGLSGAPDLESGDVALWAMCIPTDVLNNGFGTPTISSSGTTFGTAVELEEPDSGTGNDIGGYVAYASATSGTSTGAPTVGVTATGTVTNVRGPIALLRIRENLLPISGSMDATETGTDTFSGAGDVIVKGSLAATEVGNDTFNASGTVSSGPTGSMAAQEVGNDTFAGAGDVIVSGALAATETGSDTFAGSGKVIVTGSLSAQETGNDTFQGSGTVDFASIIGDMAATETGSDTASASGTVLVSGSLAATEVGQDICLADGTVLVTGAVAATEVGTDVFAGLGTISTARTGTMAATETTVDQLGGYVLDGYVASGYVETGISGTVKNPTGPGWVAFSSRSALTKAAERMLGLMTLPTVAQTPKVKKLVKKLEDIAEQQKPRVSTVEALVAESITELARQEKFAEFMVEAREMRTLITELKALKESLDDDEEEALLLLS